MKPTTLAEKSDFRSGLHHYTGPTNLLTRMVARLARMFLSVAGRPQFLGKIDLGRIATYSTEQILNLPGALPFFPTKTTELERVKHLMERLHPTESSQELVRLGPEGDGGYFVPNDLHGIQACFSPGVGNVSGFERDCAEMGMAVFMADASVDRPPETHPQFNFIKKFVGSITQGDFISLSDWVDTALPGSHSDLLLQIDIEGYEYEAILSMPNSLVQRFRIIVVEFHNLDCLFSEPIFALYSKAIEKILHTHTCVHMQPNNFCGPIRVRGLEIRPLLEVTFLRNDRLPKSDICHNVSPPSP